MTRAFAEVDGLTVRHVGRRAAALRELDLRWEEGERLLLLGPSGSGKSTLALCLDGVIPHSLEAHWESGRVTVRGRDTRSAGLAETSRLVGIVFQDPEAQLVMLEIDDEIAFGMENAGVPRQEMRRRVGEARSRMGLLGPRVPERIDRLSGGTKQRLALASVLALGSPGLVLDEPTANLDPVAAASFLGAVADLATDGTRSLLLIEHRLDDVIALVDRVAVLDGAGRLALQGTPDRIFGAELAELDALGVWVPQLAELARALGVERSPTSTSEAASLIARRWPRATARAGLAAPAAPEGVPAGEPEAEPLLSAQDLSHRYPGSPVAALDGVSIDVRRGEMLAIVGRNGAGKSTLGLALVGAMAPSLGRVLLDGRDLRGIVPHEARARLAYVFQYPEHQFLGRSVRDELVPGLRARAMTAADARRRADEALERIGLASLAGAHPHSLSHGEKRRLSVATALVTDPEVVVLDEPTFGQDRRHTESLLALLDELRRAGRTIVLITHDLSLVAEHAGRVVAMRDGSVAFDGTPAVLFQRAELLADCGLVLPPIAAAFRAAREHRPEIPALVGLRAARRALAASTVRA